MPDANPAAAAPAVTDPAKAKAPASPAAPANVAPAAPAIPAPAAPGVKVPLTDAQRADRKALRAELKALQAKGTFLANNKNGTSARNALQVNKDEAVELAKQGKPLPTALTPEECKRLHALHYLVIGQPVPIRDDLDD